MFVNAILICCCCSQLFKIRYIFKVFIIKQKTVILSCIVVTRHNPVLGLLCIYFYTNIPASL